MAESAVPTAASTPAVTIPTALPVRAVLPWALFAGLLALIALYFVGAEQGATAVFAGDTVHEWVHDGRHLLGFPCH
ncbi:CbtB domain-containing protein (plasmid) [Streptomyces sp. BI20]|uniref:CbtB domain-containing protein n=1 Tax=Streptomyces sp. BI20 TaxID=3403460 RepID=UPI003C750DAD